MKLPEFECSHPELESALNTLARAIEEVAEHSKVSVVGDLVHRSENGHHIIEGYNDGGGSSGAPGPWDVNVSPTTGGYSCTVNPGAVAGIVPSVTGGGSIFTPLAIGTATTFFICTVSTDGRQITGAVISTSTSLPAAQTMAASALPNTAAFVFGIVNNGVWYRTIQQGNPAVAINLGVVTDKTSTPAPGVPGVDRWYYFIFG